MLQDPDFWLVMLSLAVTALSLGRWITRAGDDWLQSQLDEHSFEMPAQPHA